MQDRLVFDTIKLDNGIEIYAKRWDVPFVDVRAIVPLGFGHCGAGIPPGSPHMLEHIVYSKRRKYPLPRSFSAFLELEGGDDNATTSLEQTEYPLWIPSAAANRAIAGLASRIFEPLIDDDDVVAERSVVAAERDRVGRWFPGNTELAYYREVEWMEYSPGLKQQLFGEDSDLVQTDGTMLRALHRDYFRRGLRVFVGGDFDIKEVIKMFSDFENLKDASLGMTRLSPKPSRWRKRDYHEQIFTGEDQFRYHVSAFLDTVDVQELGAVNFIGELLTNPTSGVLYEWLRHELGWVYKLHWDMDYPLGTLRPGRWSLEIPLKRYEQVTAIRSALRTKIESVLVNTGLIEALRRQWRFSSVFRFQTIGSVISSAAESMRIYGRIILEKESAELLENMDQKLLLDVYERYFAENVVGEFLSVPQGA